MGTFSSQQYADFTDRAAKLFLPFTPIDLLELFKGRVAVIRKLHEELSSPGRHAVLFGDRGVGKTSMANLMPFFIGTPDDRTHTVRCSKESTFDSMLAKVLCESGVTHVSGVFTEEELRGISFGGSGVRLNATNSKTTEYQPVDGPFRITPQMICQHIGEDERLIVIDEYDRVTNEPTHAAIADLIKQFSDMGSPAKILLVGVAESVSTLLGSHESIVRCVAEVKLRRMEPEELREILTYGFTELGLDCGVEIENRIVELSDGFPHFTHLLGLKCCRAVANRCHDYSDQPVAVKAVDYRNALRQAIQDSDQTLKSAYREATETTRKKSEIFARVVEGIAISDSKEVQVNEIVHNINEIYDTDLKPQAISYHLGKLTADDRSSILERSRTGFYKFANPMMRAFVRMKLDLDNYSDDNGQMRMPFMKLVKRRTAIEQPQEKR